MKSRTIIGAAAAGLLALSCASPPGETTQEARAVDANARAVEANARAVDANAGRIEANDRQIDGVVRTVALNDVLPNPDIGRDPALRAQAEMLGFYLPEDGDIFLEGFPSTIAPTAAAPCLDLDPGAILTQDWRILPSRVQGGDVVSGMLQIDDGSGWEDAAIDDVLYLPATVSRTLSVARGTPEERPMVLKIKLGGLMALRNPTNLAIQPGSGAVKFFKAIYVAAFCLPDTADAPTPAWIPLGPVTPGDAFLIDLRSGPDKALPGPNDALVELAPYLRWNGYNGIDPVGTVSKAETYYTGGIMARDSGAQHHWVLRSTLRPQFDGHDIHPAVINGLIAFAFANAITVPLDAPGTSDPGAVIGMTRTGTEIRVSIVAPHQTHIELPALVANVAPSDQVDWSPSEEELLNPQAIDMVAAQRLIGDAGTEAHTGPSTELCGHSDVRVEAWLYPAEEDEPDDSALLMPYVEFRDQRCDAVGLWDTIFGGSHAGRVGSWYAIPGGVGNLDDRITAVASAVADMYLGVDGNGICEPGEVLDCPPIDFELDPPPES